MWAATLLFFVQQLLSNQKSKTNKSDQQSKATRQQACLLFKKRFRGRDGAVHNAEDMPVAQHSPDVQTASAHTVVDAAEIKTRPKDGHSVNVEHVGAGKNEMRWNKEQIANIKQERRTSRWKKKQITDGKNNIQ